MQLFERLNKEAQEELTDSRAALLKGILVGQNTDESNLSRVLKDERDAWAFALKFINRLSCTSNRDTRQQILKFIHDESLAVYSDDIKKVLDPEFKGVLSDEVKEFFLEDERVED